MSNLIPTKSEYSIIPRVNASYQGKNIRMKSEQSYKTSNKIDKYVYNMNNVSTSPWGLTNDLRIDANSSQKILNLQVRYELLETGGAATVDVDVHQIAKKIELISNGGSGEVLFTWYPDDIYVNNAVLYSHIQYKGIAKLLGLNDSHALASNQLAASGTKTFYVDLLGSVLDQSKINLQSMREDLIMRFTWASAIPKSAGSGTFSVSSVALVCTHEHLSPEDKQYVLTQYAQNCHASVFLQPVEVQHLAKTITKQQENKFSLENLTGKYSHFAIMVRAVGNYNIVTGASITFVSIGDSGTIHIDDAVGTKLTGPQPMRGDELLNHTFNRHFNSQLTQNKAVYFVPFCKNIESAYQGRINDYLEFDGSACNLVLIPDSTFTNGSYDVTIRAYRHEVLYQDRGSLSKRIV